MLGGEAEGPVLRVTAFHSRDRAVSREHTSKEWFGHVSKSTQEWYRVSISWRIRPRTRNGRQAAAGQVFCGPAGGERRGYGFVIGASFVSWGASPMNVFLGLALGNLLAVLTWTFMCAPIATQTRLTLYWYLRKIAGPAATAIYNVLNAIMFCILAGCMITVSASAVRIPFGIPPQVKWYPESAGFVVVVLVVGALVTLLAILGFKRVAQFGSVCSPWMFLMFMGGAVATLRCWRWRPGSPTFRAGPSSGRPPASSSGRDRRLTGRGTDVLANHGVCVDLQPRHARRPVGYGPVPLRPALVVWGLFGLRHVFGHYGVDFAGVMGAATARLMQIAWPSSTRARSRGNSGRHGHLTVIIAGWTTPGRRCSGQPAFQSVTPGWPRWLVTLLTGARPHHRLFPFVFTKLPGFVGLYGLLLVGRRDCVCGTLVFPRIGFTRYWVSHQRSYDGGAHQLGRGDCGRPLAERSGTLHLFFLFLPIWFLRRFCIRFSRRFWSAQLCQTTASKQPKCSKRARSASASRRPRKRCRSRRT